MSRPDSELVPVTEQDVDTIIEAVVEGEFQKHLQRKGGQIPDYVIINGAPYRVSDHMGVFVP